MNQPKNVENDKNEEGASFVEPEIKKQEGATTDTPQKNTNSGKKLTKKTAGKKSCGFGIRYGG